MAECGLSGQAGEGSGSMTEGSDLGREALLGPYSVRDWGFPLHNPHVHWWEARPTQEPNGSLLLFKMTKAFGVSERNPTVCCLPFPLHSPRCHSGDSRAQANVPKGIQWGPGLSPGSAPLQPALPQLRLPPGTLGSGGLSSFHEALSHAEHCPHSFFLSQGQDVGWTSAKVWGNAGSGWQAASQHRKVVSHPALLGMCSRLCPPNSAPCLLEAPISLAFTSLREPSLLSPPTSKTQISFLM